MVNPYPTGGNSEGVYFVCFQKGEECAPHKLPLVIVGPSGKSQLMIQYHKVYFQVLLF